MAPITLSSASTLRSGEILGGKYLLVARLAAGGMGQIWTARNLATGGEVAVKALLPERASTESLLRLRREAQATAALCHRAIVRVFDLVELNPERGSLAMVMERLRGHTLAREIALNGPLTIEDTLAIAYPLLSALSHAHAAGVIHRDLKPENVFLAREPDGQQIPKIVDFGISKHLRASPITMDGEIVGTFSYMSPEQTSGAEVDERSDIFSMGILLYECLAGKNPFVDRSTKERDLKSLMAVFDVAPRPIENVPAGLWDVIRCALAMRPAARFATAADLTDALAAAVPSHCWLPPRARSSISPVDATLPMPRPAEVRRVGLRRARSPAAAVLATCFAVVVLGSAVHALSASDSSAASHRAPSARVVHEKRHASCVDGLAPESDATTATPPFAAAPASRRALAPNGGWSMLLGTQPPVRARTAEAIALDPGF